MTNNRNTEVSTGGAAEGSTNESANESAYESAGVSGRGPARLLGAPEEEAERLLARLLAAATDPAVVFRHRWRPGDLLLWDNALLLHRVEATAPGEVIRLHRSAVSGERPVGPISVAQPWVVAG